MSDSDVIEKLRHKGIELIGLVNEIPISSNHYIIEGKLRGL